MYDGSKTKLPATLPATQTRKPGQPHPYVVGNNSVRRYLTVVNECAQAAIIAVDLRGRPEPPRPADLQTFVPHAARRRP